MKKIGSWIDASWVDAYDWGCTSEPYVWECVTTGLYHYSDECSQFDIYGFNTIEECKAALDKYSAML